MGECKQTESGLQFTSTINIDLTELETDILRLKVYGYTTPAIGQKLGYSSTYIRDQWQRMRDKLHFRSLAEIIGWLEQAGLIEIKF